MNLDAAATQGSRNFKPDKTCTKNDCPARRSVPQQAERDDECSELRPRQIRYQSALTTPLVTDTAKQLGSVSKCVLRKAERKIKTTGIGTTRHLSLQTARGRVGGLRFRHLQLNPHSLPRQRVHVNIP